MRLKVAEAYVKVLSGKGGASQDKPANSQVSLSAVVNGLGPVFQLVIKVRSHDSCLNVCGISEQHHLW